jgi:phosphonopyruvate decarboxylase
VDSVGEIAQQVKVRQGTAFVQVFIEANEPPRALPPRDGPYVKNRLRAALGLTPF